MSFETDKLYREIEDWERAGRKWMINSPRVLREFLEHNDEVLSHLVKQEQELKKMKEEKVKCTLDIDWGKFDADVAKDLFKPMPDTRRPVVHMAQELERKIFTFCLVMGISKIYVWDETETRNGVWTIVWRFDDRRPHGHMCTEHDFTNLIEMSDAEFDALPPSPNTGLVKSWREMMRANRHDPGTEN